MTGIRRPRQALTDGFTIVDHKWGRSPYLSMQEKGLLTYVMSHAEGYVLTIEQIIHENENGKDAVMSTIKSLERKKLLIRGERRRGPDGRLGAYDWDLVDPSTVDLEALAKAARATKATGKPRTSRNGTDDSVSAGHDQSGKPAVAPTRPPEWKTRTGADQGKQGVSAGRNQCGFTTAVNPHSKEEQEEKNKKKNTPPSPPAAADPSNTEAEGAEPLDRQKQAIVAEVRELAPHWRLSKTRDVLDDPDVAAHPLPVVRAALVALAQGKFDQPGRRTASPMRLVEAGPWWERAYRDLGLIGDAGGAVDRFPVQRGTVEQCPDHQGEPAHNCGRCRSESLAVIR